MRLTIATLDGKWHDRDEVLLHAAFQVLVDFIEKEKPGETINWNSDKEHKHAWRAMNELYTWWKRVRPKRKLVYKLKPPKMKFEYSEKYKADVWKALDPVKDKAYLKQVREHTKQEQKWEDEDATMLHRLIDIRMFLWT